MPSRKPDSMRGQNPDLLPSRADANRHSKKESSDGTWTDLQRKRNETARELVRLRKSYREESNDIERRMEEYRGSQPEIFALMGNVRDRARANYESAHAKVAETIYAELEDAYQAIPLTEEEIERDLSVERMSAMPLKEYVELLRKLPPRFFTHVTRQGVRDSGSFHYGGVGEFHDGFGEILKSGSVTSIYDRLLEDGITRATVGTLLERLKLTPTDEPSKEEALRRLHSELTRSDVAPVSSYFADMKSIHTALETVADQNYGGENGIEIFMIWPVALIAKEYHVGTQRLVVPDKFEPDDTHKSSQFNDYWLLNKESRRGSLPLDAGIAFLPARARVNPRTGSQYEMNERNEPVPNPEVEILESVLRDPAFLKISGALEKYAMAKSAVDRDRMDIEKKGAGFRAYDDHADRARTINLRKLEEAAPSMAEFKRLCVSAGITNPRILEIPNDGWLANQSFRTLVSLAARPTLDEYAKLDRESSLGNLGIKYALAKKTVSSRDYWEEHFKQTGKRPSKVVYYDQRDPTEALDAFKRIAGIDRSASEVDLKTLYEGNLIGQHGIKEVLEPEAKLVWEVGQELIEELYAKPKPVRRKKKK